MSTHVCLRADVYMIVNCSRIHNDVCTDMRFKLNLYTEHQLYYEEILAYVERSYVVKLMLSAAVCVCV